ncbi:MAG: flagellar biosynthesis protein FlhF [Deltaproteobacteria bacterium]|nr:flagellar biosynthesis protein FlhF [Deltaproteobacteria bacterium]
MQLKRYEARSISEAMIKIKSELGSNAIVLSTKRLTGEKSALIEVLAARDDNYIIPDGQEYKRQENDTVNMLSVIKSDVNELRSLFKDFKRERDVYTELTELKETVGGLLDVLGIRKNGKISSPLSQAYYYLVSTGISKRKACALLEELKKCNPAEDLKDFDHILNILESMISKSIASSYHAADDKRISAFIGPTGEGKTTTLAKLAAHYLFKEKLNVGIITMDTYRIGAAEQLKTYARIMDVPMKVASDNKEFKRIVNKLADRDIILVDTPGRSRNDEGHLAQLRNYLKTDLPVETNLVLSMTSSKENMVDAVTRFNIMDYDNIIFTKLDDSTKFGFMYNIIDRVKKPVWYITDGQGVPEDIQRVNPGELAQLIVNNRVNKNLSALSN